MLIGRGITRGKLGINILRHFGSLTTKPQEVVNADSYILENLRNKDWGTFLVSNYLPKEIRSAFHTINWFSNELGKIPETSREPSLAMGKIEFWRGILHRVYTRQNPSQQPISISLNWVCNNHPVTNIYFERIIDARVFEINNKEIESMAQLFQLAESVKTSLILLTLELLRIPITPQIEQVAVEAGRAIGICDYIKRVPYNLRTYRLYLPNQITSKHNVSVRNLWDRIHGKPKEELFDVVLQVAAFARQSLLRAKKLKGNLPPEAFRAFLWLIETQLYLENLEKYNFNVFEKAMHQPPVLALPQRLFSAARRKSFTYND